MEPYQLWREEYRREVERVLAELRARKKGGAVVRAALPAVDLGDAIVPPSGFYQELQALKAELALLKPQLELKSQQLEAELRRRSRIKDIAESLNAHLAAAAARLQDAVKRLEAERRRALDGELDESRRRMAEALRRKSASPGPPQGEAAA